MSLKDWTTDNEKEKKRRIERTKVEKRAKDRRSKGSGCGWELSSKIAPGVARTHEDKGGRGWAELDYFKTRSR